MKPRYLPIRPRSGVCLYCDICGETFSATRGDYFAADPCTPMLCHERPLRLVEKRVRYVNVSPDRAEARS